VSITSGYLHVGKLNALQCCDGLAALVQLLTMLWWKAHRALMFRRLSLATCAHRSAA
jgi:hypothetical protein